MIILGTVLVVIACVAATQDSDDEENPPAEESCCESSWLEEDYLPTEPGPRTTRSAWIPQSGGGGEYLADGVRYAPRMEPGYEAEGYATVHGVTGLRTANGEMFDENVVMAAHRTLPLPSYVRVTNLDNNLEVVARVNDRGPFGREDNVVIGLSRAGARALGFESQGVARVRVRYIGPAPSAFSPTSLTVTPSARPRGEVVELVEREARTRDAGASETRSSSRDRRSRSRDSRVDVDLTGPFRSIPPMSVTRLADEPPRSTPRRDDRGDEDDDVRPYVADVGGGQLYVQVASFRDRDRARQLTGRLGGLGQATVTRVQVGGGEWHRVRVGPLRSRSEALQARDAVARMGFTDAQVMRIY